MNVTLNYSESIPLSQLYTGQSSTDKIRGYARYKGSPTIEVWEDFFDGQSIIQHYRRPYEKDIHVKGSDGFQFGAGLSDSSSLYYFDDFALRTLKFNYYSRGQRGSVETLRFRVDSKSIAQPDQCPDNLKCPIANISAVHKIPLVYALPNYADCNLVVYL